MDRTLKMTAQIAMRQLPTTVASDVSRHVKGATVFAKSPASRSGRRGPDRRFDCRDASHAAPAVANN
jgi:hypothetical protein